VSAKRPTFKCNVNVNVPSSQTAVHWIVMLGSVLSFFISILAYNALCVTCNPPSNPYWVLQNQLTDPVFHLVCLLTVVVALMPR